MREGQRKRERSEGESERERERKWERFSKAKGRKQQFDVAVLETAASEKWNSHFCPR